MHRLPPMATSGLALGPSRLSCVRACSCQRGRAVLLEEAAGLCWDQGWKLRTRANSCAACAAAVSMAVCCFACALACALKLLGLQDSMGSSCCSACHRQCNTAEGVPLSSRDASEWQLVSCLGNIHKGIYVYEYGISTSCWFGLSQR